MIIPLPKQTTATRGPIAELEFRASQWGAENGYIQSAGNWVYDAERFLVGPDWLYVYEIHFAEIDLWWREQQVKP